MAYFTLINTAINLEPLFIYVSLDSLEGANCAGHWIWECSVLLPHIKELKNHINKPLKILLNGQKKYKTNINTHQILS